MKRLIFEAQTLLSAELQSKVRKTDEQVKSKLAPAERETTESRNNDLDSKDSVSKEKKSVHIKVTTSC